MTNIDDDTKEKFNDELNLYYFVNDYQNMIML